MCRFRGVVAAIVVAGCGTTAAAQPSVLTLGEAVRIALARSDRVADARQQVHEADVALRRARAAFQPRLTPSIFSAFAQTAPSNQSYEVSFSELFSTGTSITGRASALGQRNQLGRFFLTDTTLDVSQPLLRGLGEQVVRRDVLDAEAIRLDAEDSEAAVRSGLVVDIATSYYQAVVMRRQVEVATAAVVRARALADAAQARLNVGRVSQLDVLRARQLLVHAEGQAADAEATAEDAEDELRALMGVGDEYVFAVAADIGPTLDVPSVEEATAAVPSRPELRVAQRAADRAVRAVTTARNRALPNITAHVALTRQGTTDTVGRAFGLDAFRAAAFLGASFPLDRSETSLAIASAELTATRLQRVLERRHQSLVREARRAVRQYASAARQLQAADTMVDITERERQVATLRYERGLSDNLEMISAEQLLLAARAQHLAARAEVAVAALRARLASGLLSPDQLP